MDKNNINMHDEELKEILSGTKVKAPENMRFRIMQQIETEKALSRKKTPKANPIFGNLITIFGVMYALIGIIAFGIYSTMGKGALESKTFYIPVLMITFVCAIYWMITSFDEQRHSKDKDNIK